MARVKLNEGQAKLLTQELADRIEGIMESATVNDADVLQAVDQLPPLAAALRELQDTAATDNLSLLREAAVTVTNNGRHDAGHALLIAGRVEAGAVVEWRYSKDETAAEAIERYEEEAKRHAADATAGWLVIQAIDRIEQEDRAAAGDPRAREGLRELERWDEENAALAGGEAGS